MLRDSEASKTGRPLLPNQHAGNQAQQQQTQQRPATVQARACASNCNLSPAASKLGRKTLGALLESASHDFKHKNRPFAATGHCPESINHKIALSVKQRRGATCMARPAGSAHQWLACKRPDWRVTRSPALNCAFGERTVACSPCAVFTT